MTSGLFTLGRCTAAEAFEQLPPNERVYTGSTAGNAWPYELR